MHPMGRSCPRIVLTFVAAMAVLITPGASAGAEPATAAEITLGLAQLGGSDTLEFAVGADPSSSTVSFQFPSGMAPQSFAAAVDLPLPLSFSMLTVSQGSRILARGPLPAGEGGAFDIPIAGARAFGGWGTLTFTLLAVPDEEVCSAAVRLGSAAVRFRGADPTPQTVADFLPEVLTRASVELPPQPSPAEADAAVQLAAVIARRYRAQSPQIVTTTGGPGPARPVPAGGPLERRIVVREAPAPGLSVWVDDRGAALLISGPPGQLTNQARLLAEDLLPFAQSPRVDVVSAPPDQAFAPPSATLAQLEITTPGRGPRRTFTIDQTRFGHSLSDVALHLLGSHTPLARDVGGEVVVEADGIVIDRWPAEPGGEVDRRIAIPRSQIRRSIEIRVSVATSERTDRGCHGGARSDLRISPSTTISTARTGEPAAQGFQSLPQALMPVVTFGLASNSPGQVAQAVRIAAGLQRSSGVLLVTSVTSVRQAVDGGGPAVLIAPDGLAEGSVGLPFRAGDSQVAVSARDPRGEPQTLTLDPGTGFGSLQTVFDGRRTLLVATSNRAPARLGELLDWLDAERARWPSLEGRAVITVPGSDPVTLPNPDVPADAEPGRDAASPGGSGWIPWAAGSVVLLATAGAVGSLLAIRRSRSRAARGPVGGDRPEDPPPDEQGQPPEDRP
jgi:hypothetical protein